MSEEQLAAARDCLADGLSRSETVDVLRSQFGLSPATAYRRVAAAMAMMESSGPTESVDDGGTVDLASEALGTMLRLMQRAEDAGDETEALARAKALAAAVARLRILHLRL